MGEVRKHINKAASILTSYFASLYKRVEYIWGSDHTAEINIAMQHIETAINLAVREAIASTRAMIDAAADFAVDPDLLMEELLGEDEPITPERFIEELLLLCRECGYSLSLRQDYLIIERYDPDSLDWIREAIIDVEEDPE